MAANDRSRREYAEREVGGDSKADEGAGAGAVGGTVVGGALGAGIGAATGGLIGGLVGAGIPEDEAGSYAEGVRRGGTLVAVSADDRSAGTARDIMQRHNVIDIDGRMLSMRSFEPVRCPHLEAADDRPPTTDD